MNNAMVAFFLFIQFALAWLLPFFWRLTRSYSGWIFSLIPLSFVLYLFLQGSLILQGQSLITSLPWMTGGGIWFSFYLDGWSWFFALVINLIGALIFIYSGKYLEESPEQGRFFAFLLLFNASMTGVVLADNLITLFIFWEITSLSSYLLIGFEHQRKEARQAALQALLVTGLGGLALLAGFLLLMGITGEVNLHGLLTQGDLVKEHPYYLPILILVILGAFTKSAQFPFHFWLPNAMEAPTPVSAFLHSATMVKAGVYLLARLQPVLGGTEYWQGILTGVGGITMLWGAGLAVMHTEFKKILAYSTVSALGILVLLIGIGTQPILTAMVIFLLAHALYKAALFMVAGAVTHQTGAKEVNRLGSLFKDMPISALTALLAAFSMAGIPPLWGFIAKEMFLESLGTAPYFSHLLMGAGILSSVLLVAAAAMVGLEPFWGKKSGGKGKISEASPGIWLGPVLLVLVSLALGFWPQMGAPLLARVVAPISGTYSSLHLHLWHGFNLTLALSASVIIAGGFLYLLRDRLRSLTGGAKNLAGMDGVYDAGIFSLNRLSIIQTGILQNGYLRIYLMIILIVGLGLISYPLVQQLGRGDPLPTLKAELYEWVVAAVMVTGAWVAALARSRLVGVAALGVVGYGAALFFIFYGAPDLAMTQFLIETLTVILFILVLYHLPPFSNFSTGRSRYRDGLLSLAVGAMMSALVLITNHVQFSADLSNFFAQKSLTEAHGRNVVNVILVDFRALDTLGEISVLTLAAIGVYGLLKFRQKKEEEK